MARSAISRLASRYGVVIFFPTFTVASIFADWSHTRTWKQQQKQLAKEQELLQHQ